MILRSSQIIFLPILWPRLKVHIICSELFHLKSQHKQKIVANAGDGGFHSCASYWASKGFKTPLCQLYFCKQFVSSMEDERSSWHVIQKCGLDKIVDSTPLFCSHHPLIRIVAATCGSAPLLQAHRVHQNGLSSCPSDSPTAAKCKDKQQTKSPAIHSGSIGKASLSYLKSLHTNASPTQCCPYTYLNLICGMKKDLSFQLACNIGHRLRQVLCLEPR